jgi:hypothetical protein
MLELLPKPQAVSSPLSSRHSMEYSFKIIPSEQKALVIVAFIPRFSAATLGISVRSRRRIEAV